MYVVVCFEMASARGLYLVEGGHILTYREPSRRNGRNWYSVFTVHVETAIQVKGPINRPPCSHQK